MMKRILAFLMVLCMSIYLVPLEALALDAAYAAYQDELCAAGLCTHVDQARKTAKGEIHWSGGDPNCDHYQYKWNWKWVYEDKEYHVETATCSHCGAQGKTINKQKHEWETSELSPGGPQYPEGGTIYYCPICEYEYVVPNGSCKHKHTTKKWDETNHWDECDDCHAHLNVKGHKKGKVNKDDNKHWYACTGCGARLEEGAHVAQYWKHSNDEHWKTCWCGVEVQGTRGPHNPEWDYDDSKHWQTCECGWESKATKHTLEDHQLPDGTVEHACTVCPFNTTSTLPDLSQRKLTNVKSGDDPKYNSSEIKKVGLEGLKEGKDYTTEITTQNNDDGSESWVKTFKSVEGKSTGEKTFRAKKKGQEGAEEGRKYKLTVYYAVVTDQSTDVNVDLPPTVTRWYAEGKSYDVPTPEVKGMVPNVARVHDIMPKHDVTVTVFYSPKKYTLTIHYVMPLTTGQDTDFGEGIRDVTLQLKDGDAYRVETKEITSDKDSPFNRVTEAGEWGGNFFGMSLWLGMAPAWVPDREVVEGRIEGTDKEETVTFTCPHPDKWLRYEPNDNDEKGKAGTHSKTCTACYSLLAEEEPCAYGEPKYITAADLEPADREETPNGRYLYTCSKCEDSYILSADDEPCPESPEGLPHIWTLWYKADAETCHRTCARCGLDVTEPHVWSSWTSMGGLHHYRKCAHCKEIEEGDHGSWKNVTVTSPATCIENAQVDATCGVCNARVTNVSASLLGKEYLATGHDFENGPWHIDGPSTVSAEGAGGHYKSCAVCGVTDREHMTGHTWGGKTVISAGVCDDPSQKHVEEATCTACNAKLHTETEVHHDQVRYPEGDIAPTCEDYGKEAYKCSHCNTVFGDAIAPLGHDMQGVEKTDADCEHEGYIKRKCSRCNLEETETLEKKSKSGKHQWVPNVSVPDCLLPGEAKGETCSVCGATQAGKTGYETFPALGHKVIKETRTVGRTREYVSDNGVTECTCYEVYYICERCGHALGHEYYTVGRNPNISRYQIEPGKNVRIDDVSGGIHIDGNMANDGGVYFNDEVKKGLNDLLDWAGGKYVWKKTPANSYIIEFTDEFLAELEDGEYKLEITNGNEYWPMIVVVKDHKLVEIKNLPEEEFTGVEFTPEQFEAWKRDVTADGTVLREYFMGCPDRAE